MVNTNQGSSEVIIEEDERKDSEDYIFKNLSKRCCELMEKYPANNKLFENYIKKQREEKDALEKVVCSTMAIKKGHVRE